MALLQISEPGQAPDPHQRRIAVGIDLGTTHSLVAAVRSGIAECLPDANGRVILPSVVRYLENNGRQIGHEAQAAQALDPRNTIASVKRFMGRGLADIGNREKLPYQFVEAGDTQSSGMVTLQTRAGDKSPVEISAEILATFREYLGPDLEIEVEFVDSVEMVRTGKRLASVSRLNVDFQASAPRRVSTAN